MQQKKAERITITLPPDMLASIKKEVRSGSYASTSELIREAMRMWQKREEEHKARISLIRERLAHSEQSGEPVPLNIAFKTIEELHQQRSKKEV
ncbi:MAG: type II toxin-antitoxin system ParD family antitoxin [Desulfobacteraceae bacterium]|nr:type II toxin-antitoxin system ParD family antitoxin [Desulfobacteraceae bacterium]